jgi:hypothetical protein
LRENVKAKWYIDSFPAYYYNKSRKEVFTMDWKKTDPEFAERFEHFAFDKVVNEDGQQLPGETGILPFWRP